MLHLLGNIRQARVSAKLSQAEMADILGVSQQVYSNIEAGKVKKVSAEVAKKYQDWAITNNLVEEPTLTYQKSRLESKLNGSREDVPVYNGSTTLGNITLFSDENKEQIATLPQTVFPGCDYAEKASGDSMYPLIMNQALLVGRKCPPAGLTYCL